MKRLIIYFVLFALYNTCIGQVTPNYAITSVPSNTGYYSVSDIFSTTTLTASSTEYIRSWGTITIQLPNPATCVSGGLYRKFTIIKGDLGINTLTITDHNGSTLATETSKGVVHSFICLGSIWIQLQ